MSRLSFALTTAIALVALAVTAAFSQERPSPTRFGFIDVKKVWDTYRKSKTVSSQIKEKVDALSAQFKARQAEIEQQADKLNTLNAGSDEYDKLQRDIAIAKDMLKFDRESAGRKIDQEQAKQRAGIYKEISQEADSFRAERGLVAILPYFPPDTDFERDVDMFILTRSVIARDESLDVTKDVVDRLNALLPPAPLPPK